MKHYGFTLSEVLITLSIIGVVAAITLPSVINNIRGVKLESRFKKTTSDFQNALSRVQYDEGYSIYGHITSDEVSKVLIKYFPSPPAKIVSKYNIKQGKLNNKNIVYKKYNGISAFDTRLLDDGTIIVNDEFFIFINNDNNWLNNQQFYIDINGFNEPNREGYDLFKFCLAEGDRVDYNCNTYTKRAFLEKDYFKKLP